MRAARLLSSCRRHSDLGRFRPFPRGQWRGQRPLLILSLPQCPGQRVTLTLGQLSGPSPSSDLPALSRGDYFTITWSFCTWGAPGKQLPGIRHMVGGRLGTRGPVPSPALQAHRLSSRGTLLPAEALLQTSVMDSFLGRGEMHSSLEMLHAMRTAGRGRPEAVRAGWVRWPGSRLGRGPEHSSAPAAGRVENDTVAWGISDSCSCFQKFMLNTS